MNTCERLNQAGYMKEFTELSADALQVLANEEVGAIVVKNFYDEAFCEKANAVFNSQKQGYINAPSIGRVGMAYFEADGQPELIEKYYNNARQGIELMRSAFAPYVSPMDLLRLRLQEAWIPGANLENLDNRKMFVGLTRVVAPNVDFLVHQDDLRVDAPDSLRAKSLQGQFAANIYLDIANEGGELDMWDMILDDATYDDLREPGVYGIERDRLPPPTCSYKPEVGDLVIFNCRRLHAVSASKDKSRLSISCFIGYRGEKQPLTYWS